jgi:succinyl-diaminopimelate desuccinylase
MDRMTTQALLEAIDDRFHAEVELLAALVREPSDNPPGDCAGHADLTARALEGLGFEVERHVVPADAVAQAGATYACGAVLIARPKGVHGGLASYGCARIARLQR